MKVEIKTDEACLPVGVYSQAVMANNLIFISAQSPIDGNGGGIVNGDAESHIRQSFKNVLLICKASGAQPDDIVKITAYLTSTDDFSALNSVMREMFTKPYPARTTLIVDRLPEGAKAEIDAIVSL